MAVVDQTAPDRGESATMPYRQEYPEAAAINRSSRTPRLLETRDFFILGGLACLAPLAWLLPPNAWPAVTATIARRAEPWLRRRRPRNYQRMQELARLRTGTYSAAAIHAQWIANRAEEQLQYLRDYPAGALRLQLSLSGRQHVEQALDRRKGAILWVAPQIFAPLLVKRAFAEAGFALSHLSREYHGPSETRFGRRVINPLTVGRESRYLHARYAMTEGAEPVALRQLVKTLRGGEIISMTCAGYGQRVMPIPLLGGRLPVATGAPALAMLSGAPLLPVLLTRHGATRFEVIVNEPLAPPPTSDRGAAHADLLMQYAALLDAHLGRDPAAFADWRNLEPAD